MSETVTFDRKRPIDFTDIIVIGVDIAICAALPFYQKLVFAGFSKVPPLPYPVLVTGIQMILCAVILFLTILARSYLSRRRAARHNRPAPVASAPFRSLSITYSMMFLPAFLFCLQIGLDNLALVRLDVYLHSLLRLITCFAIPAASWAVNRITDTPWLILTATIISGGLGWLVGTALVQGTASDPTALTGPGTAQSIICAVVAAVVTGFYVACMQRGLRGLRGLRVAAAAAHPLETAFWINIISGTLLLCASTVMPRERGTAWHAVFKPPAGAAAGTFGLLLLGGLLTSGFKVCGCYLAQRNPAVTTAIVLVAKTTIQTITSVSLRRLWRPDMVAALLVIAMGLTHFIGLRTGLWARAWNAWVSVRPSQ